MSGFAKSFAGGVVALYLAALLVGCSVNWRSWSAPVWVEETEESEVPAAGLDRLRCETHNGPITLRAAAPGVETIHVRTTRRAGGGDEAAAREALAALVVVQKTSGDLLELRGEWRPSVRFGWSGHVAFEVTLPARFDARLETHNGEVRVVGLDGSLSVSSHNGDLVLDTNAADVEATTHNGAIDYRGAAARIDLETHNGHVGAALTGGVAAGSIETHNGAITLEVSETLRGTIRGKTGNGRIALHARALVTEIEDDEFELGFADRTAGHLEIETHNGAIEVR